MNFLNLVPRALQIWRNHYPSDTNTIRLLLYVYIFFPGIVLRNKLWNAEFVWNNLPQPKPFAWMTCWKHIIQGFLSLNKLHFQWKIYIRPEPEPCCMREQYKIIVNSTAAKINDQYTTFSITIIPLNVNANAISTTPKQYPTLFHWNIPGKKQKTSVHNISKYI